MRTRRRLSSEDEERELNIVPYLDILINLIMFLLIAQSTLISLGAIPINAETYAPPGPTPPPPSSSELRLTLGVAETGFILAAKGGVLPIVPKRADGSYDFQALAEQLRMIKAVFPETDTIHLTADANLPYETVVKTLDATREDQKGPLFPNVAFARIE